MSIHVASRLASLCQIAVQLLLISVWCIVCTAKTNGAVGQPTAPANQRHFSAPKRWEYSAPLISPEERIQEPSRAQKDPTVVRHGDQWHVFMTVKLPGRSAIEHCSFKDWDDANNALGPSCGSVTAITIAPTGLLLQAAQEMVLGLPDGSADIREDVGCLLDN